MNYELEVSQSNPVVFNTLTGTRPPLVAGSGTASLLTTNLDTTFTAWNRGYENDHFTTEVWFLPLTNTGELVVIGHPTEGVIWDGTKFTLRMNFQDGTVAEGSWTPIERQAYHVVFTYSVGQATLYINGEIAVSLELPWTPFLATGAAVSINRGTGTGVYDSLALYYRALTDSEVKSHYAWGNDVMDASLIAMRKKGTTFSLTYSDVDVLESIRFDSSNWDLGLADGVSGIDRLVADTEAGGTWQTAIPLEGLVGGTTAGVHLTYVGQGVTMAYSTDAVTWTPVENKITVLEDAVTTGAVLYVRFTFTAVGWLSSLTFDVLANRIMQPLSGVRSLTFKSVAMDQTAGNQLDYQSDWGATLGTQGRITVSRDTTENPQSIGTTEMWVKIDGFNATSTILDGELADGTTSTGWVNFTSTALTWGQGTLYVNGVVRSGSAPLEIGLWHHLVMVESSSRNMESYVGSNRNGTGLADISVGHLAYYTQVMTAAQVASLYNLNVGAPALRFDDPGGINMSEDTPATSIFAYTWSYASGGS